MAYPNASRAVPDTVPAANAEWLKWQNEPFDVDCAHCLMPIEIADARSAGGYVYDFTWHHVITADVMCDNGEGYAEPRV